MAVHSGDDTSLPLHTVRVDPIAYFNRFHAFVYAAATFALFYHHLTLLLAPPSTLAFFLTLSLLLADAVLFFMWAVTQGTRWRPVRREAYPDRLLKRIDRKDFPAMDMYICTADPYKEPPLGVVETALAVMAYDYPPEKMAMYVSDDGGSQLTLFAFMEAARFAKHWLPFCRENDILERSPETYLSSHNDKSSEKMKILYEKMKQRVDGVMEKGYVDEDLLMSEEERVALKKWTPGFIRQEHPAVIQVILDSSKDVDISGKPLPSLIYVAREKSKSYPHNFKAGAQNVLLRVSAAMTNAPVLLTLDCDMISNYPRTPDSAMCFLVDNKPIDGKPLSYVQFPQRYRMNRGDIYGNELKRLFQIQILGLDGSCGPNFCGTNAFFHRRSLHEPPAGGLCGGKGLLSSEEILSKAHKVASCTFEQGTDWGTKVGFRYGSLVEDYYTSILMHCEGWRSVLLNPERPAFLGDVPITLNDALMQAKRWCLGLLEVGFCRHSPLTYGVKHMSLLMGLCYAQYAFWGLWGIPVMIYGIVPQITLLHQLPLFPNAHDPWFYLYLYLFWSAYLHDLYEAIRERGTFYRWYNDQRTWLIRGVTCYPLSVLELALKSLGFSVGFNVTSKVMARDQVERYAKCVFDFGAESPYMVTIGVFSMMSLVPFALGLFETLRQGCVADYAVQLLICGFAVVNCWPIYEGMFLRSDSGRMPKKCVAQALLTTAILCSITYFLFKI